MRQAAIPTLPLLQGFDYVPAARTDITVGWRKLGWLTKAERESEIKAQATVKRARHKEHNNASS